MQGLVTVFGGSGFVGGQVVRALAKAGHRVRVAVRNPNLAYAMRMLGDVGQIEVVQANVRNAPSVRPRRGRRRGGASTWSGCSGRAAARSSRPCT
jgi:nucleoside-diphosphate-sugar epimerase